MSKILPFQAGENMYIKCICYLIPYCIGVWGGVSQCTSRCKALNKIHIIIVKNMFSKFFFNSRSIFKEARTLKVINIYVLNFVFEMYNISKQ